MFGGSNTYSLGIWMSREWSPSQGSKVFGEVFAVTVTLKFNSELGHLKNDGLFRVFSLWDGNFSELLLLNFGKGLNIEIPELKENLNASMVWT